MQILPAAKAARQVEAFMTDALCGLIGSRTDFLALMNMCEKLMAMLVLLPDDADPDDSIFNVIVDGRHVVAALRALVGGQISLGTDFTNFQDLEQLMEPTAEKKHIEARVSSAIASNDRLSVKASSICKISKTLFKHGPTLQQHMKQMKAITAAPESVSQASQTFGEAIGCYEKYAVLIPKECLTEYQQLIVDGLTNIQRVSLDAGGVGEAMLKDVLQSLEAAQRVFHTCTQFDEPIGKVKAKLRQATEVDKETKFKSCLQLFEKSDLDTADMQALANSLEELKTFALTDEMMAMLAVTLGVVFTSLEYAKPGGSEEVEAKAKVLTALAHRLGKDKQKLVSLKIAALQSARQLLQVLDKYSSEEGAEDKKKVEPSEQSSDLTMMFRLVKAIKDAKAKLDKFEGENTSELEELITAGTAKCTTTAGCVADEIMKTALPDIKELAGLVKGVEVPDDKQVWTQMLTAEANEWPQFSEIAKKHFLPLDAKKLAALITRVNGHNEKFKEVVATHSVAREFADGEKTLKTARTSLSMHALLTKFLAPGCDAGSLRRITREELQKLKRWGVQPTEPPVGLQARCTAAMKGKLL